MAIFRCTFTFVDTNNGTTTRTYEGDFTTTAAAETAANDLLTDVQALSDAAVIKRELTQVLDVASVAGANSNVFETAQFSTTLAGKSGLFTGTFPSPIESVFAGNALIFGTGNEYDDFIANFVTGADLWRVSDGDAVGATVRGKRTFRGSGKTNLPV